MSGSRRLRGLPVPRLGLVVVLLATVVGCWLLYSEHRSRLAPEAVQSPPRKFIERTHLIEALVQDGPAALPELVSMLSSPDSTTRRNALDVLWRLGPDAGDALEAVRTRLADEDPIVRDGALKAFSRISEDTDDLIAVAARSLEDTDEKVRVSATETLVMIGPRAGPQVLEIARGERPADGPLVMRLLLQLDPRHDLPGVAEALRRLVDHLNATARREAIRGVLLRSAPRPDEVRAWLHDTDPQIVREALHAIQSNSVEAAADFLPDLQGLLEYSAGALLSNVFQALGSLKTAARPAIPLLMHRVETLDGKLRLAGAEALFDIGAGPEPVIRIVVPLLANRPREIDCQTAGMLLVRASPDEARRLVSQLIGEIEANETTIDDTILYSLWGLAPQAQAAVPVLTRLISHSDRNVRRLAVYVLGNIGGDAATAVPILLRSLERERADSQMPEAVVRALGQIGPPARPAVTALVRIIRPPADRHETSPADTKRQRRNGLGPSPATRIGVFSLRGQHNGPPDPMDWRAPQSDSTKLCIVVLDALALIGDAAPDVVAAVHYELTDSDSEVRATAVLALVKLAATSAETLPAIMPMLDDNDRSVRLHAALAIGYLSGDRRESIARLTALLTDDDPNVCTAAALALREIGPDATSAVPALSEIAVDPRNSVPNRIRLSAVYLYKYQFVLRGKDLGRLSVAAAARSALAAIDPQAGDRSGDSKTPVAEAAK